MVGNFSLEGNMKTYWKVTVNNKVVEDALLYETHGVNVLPNIEIVKNDIREFYSYNGKLLGNYKNVTIERYTVKNSKKIRL
jgi:hypothetical protein